MTDLANRLRDIVLHNPALTDAQIFTILDAAEALERMEVTA